MVEELRERGRRMRGRPMEGEGEGKRRMRGDRGDGGVDKKNRR